ncbi:GGDEF domain-containing protein [Sporanaerobium hydrogeniformans]|uniref:GGDEF domain-containing protein n=2 Tax=Sporanaerobium hydrogeniformans TaxID=3072179 RepID=A0AC61DB05_9FIRM|nr:GGDEF domain-containing protein [Sporanaerobium hydrogeniformans]
MPYPLWITDLDSNILFLNSPFEELFHVKFNRVKGRKSSEIFGQEQARLYEEQKIQCIQTGRLSIIEVQNNSETIGGYIFPLKDRLGQIQAVAGIVMNVNERKRREAQIEQQKDILRTIIDAMPQAIFYKDEESRFKGYNRTFEQFYKEKGITEIQGKTDLDILEDKIQAKVFMEQDQEILQSKQTKCFECTTKNAKGQLRIEENVKIPVLNSKGEAYGIVGVSRDITQQKTLEEKLRYLSEVDILTGLYNRHSFEEKIEELNKEEYMPLGIIMGDVNGLKLVNDTLGHMEGDKLIKSISEVLYKVCEGRGYAFRWGGDEFIILLPNHDESQCEEIINTILEECNRYEYEFVQLSVALGESIKQKVDEDIYTCIKKVEDKVYRQKLLEKKSIRSSVMSSLQKSLEEKNMETEIHTERVTAYAQAIGKLLNLKISELDELTLAAQLHDIGKIGISEEILLKAEPLTEEEFRIMKTHAEKGYRIINASSELVNVATCVLTHHERWDGKGYPLGLKGEEIPLLARIIHIADAYDTMMQERVYKKAMSKEKAKEELKRCAETQFDPGIVGKFINYLENQE